MTWQPKGKIVAPIDFSEESLAALDTAIEIADAASQIHIVHVLPDLSPADPVLCGVRSTTKTARVMPQKRSGTI